MKIISNKIAKSITILCFFALAGCTWLDNSQDEAELSNHMPITTTSGQVQGKLSSSGGKQVISWYDIPYAQPPVGQLRWRAPRALNTPQNLIRDKEHNACVQMASNYAGAAGEGIVGTEDCL